MILSSINKTCPFLLQLAMRSPTHRYKEDGVLLMSEQLKLPRLYCLSQIDMKQDTRGRRSNYSFCIHRFRIEGDQVRHNNEICLFRIATF